MQSPETQNEKETLPASMSIVEVPDGFPSPHDSVSRLSEPSVGMVATLTSPIRATDLGPPQDSRITRDETTR